MRLNERPSASIRINRARKTYPAGKARDCEISVRSRRSWAVNTRGSAVNGMHIETHDLCSWLLCDNPLGGFGTNHNCETPSERTRWSYIRVSGTNAKNFLTCPDPTQVH